MNKVKAFFNNGGKERVVYWTILITLFVYLFKGAFGSGEYKNKIEVNTRDILELKNRISCLEDIQKNIAELKANQKIILEILKGEYKK